MTTEARRFYLLSQVFCASVSAVFWLPFAIGAVLIIPREPIPAVLVLGYGLVAAVLIVRWIQSSRANTTRPRENVAGVVLWAVPFLVSVFGIAVVLWEQFDGRPNMWEGEEFSPLTLIWLPLMPAVWFSVPLLFSLLLLRGERSEKRKAHPPLGRMRL